MTDLLLRFPNLNFVSLICSSVDGLSLLLGTKVVGSGYCFPLNGCLNDFSNLIVMFLTY